MKAALLDIICCPACYHPLTLTTYEYHEPEIWEGILICSQCQMNYPVHKGMPHLYVDDERWQPKAKESEGWITIHKNLGDYEPVENAVDLKIPYFPEPPWIAIADSFDIALAELHLTGKETVLDLGAGRGWAAKHFSQRGCRVVALDVVSDENVGLGRARALMDDAGVYFDRLIGDGENLPFFDGRFDIVFCAAALHHALELPLFIKNISRALKPGGQLCAINEPCLNIFSSGEKLLARSAAQELAAGINETRPNLFEYEAAMQEAGLEIISAFPPQTYGMEMSDLRQWAKKLGAIRPSIIQRPFNQHVLSWARYIARRALGLVKGTLFRANAYLAATERRQLEAAMLLWVGGEIFLLARKRDNDSKSSLLAD